MKHSLIKLALIGALTVPSFAYADEKQEVDNAFAQWQQALSTGNPANVVNHYDAKAILLPTLSAKVLTTQQERTDYFTNLMAKPKLAVKVNEEHIKVLDENNAVLSGLYTFSYADKDKTVEIPARFSFVYEKANNQWKIIEHHSSKVP